MKITTENIAEVAMIALVLLIPFQAEPVLQIPLFVFAVASVVYILAKRYYSSKDKENEPKQS